MTPMMAWLRKKSKKERAALEDTTPLHALKNEKDMPCWSRKDITVLEERNVSGGRHDLFHLVLRSQGDYDRGCKKSSDLEDGFYKDTIKLGPEYLTRMDDEGEVTAFFRLTNKIACKKFLIKNEEEIFTDAGDGVRIYPDGVATPAMLYLMRRSLKVLRKFHWMILEGRFNQLLHVSSPLLSKPREY
ncbi:hypothetical protein Tco_0305570 [Tanacetum coccineum]